MITILHVTTMLGLILLPLLKASAKKSKPVVYKNDHDTSQSHYAVNAHGYLEEITGNKVSGQAIS